MSLEVIGYKEIMVTAMEMYGDVSLHYTDAEEVWKAFQDYGNSFDEGEYGQKRAAHWNGLMERFCPNGWVTTEDEADDCEKNDAPIVSIQLNNRRPCRRFASP
jgi:hypothetical protein